MPKSKETDECRRRQGRASPEPSPCAGGPADCYSALENTGHYSLKFKRVVPCSPRLLSAVRALPILPLKTFTASLTAHDHTP